MADAKQRILDTIIGRSLLTAETFASELREQLVSQITRSRQLLTDAEIIDLARNLLDRWEPFLVQAMTDAELAAWVAGADSVVDRLPAPLRDLIGGPRQPPGGPLAPLLAGGADEPVITFPLIERAAESLLERNIVTRPEFDRLGRAARQRSFTVAAQDSQDALDTIRNTLAETIQEGASLGEFRKRLGEDLDGSFLGPSHRELVYRNAIQTSFHQAHDELASLPIVSEIFPYQEILPIRDGRVRENHLALATLGLNGTGVYRRDDPFWDLFLPPWAHF